MKHARLAAAILLLAPSLLLAQAQGRIKGLVLTTAKKPIAGAKIIITCPEITNYRREIATDEKGSYATIIADGTKEYMFHVEAVGYQPMEQMNKPRIGGQTLELNFTLISVAELQEAAQKAVQEQPGVKEQREGAELLAAGKKAEAKAKFQAAVAAMPDLYLSWFQLGKLEFDDGKAKEALADAEKCLASQAGFSPCLGLALNSAHSLGDKALIAKYEAEYKTANPTDPSIYYNEAVTYLNKGDDAKAKPLLEQALQADPKHADTLFQLGMVYFRTGDSAKAKELLQRFLEIAPDHKEAPTAKEMLKYM
jgi:tetratricopeptide (TPR) repeat protein